MKLNALLVFALLGFYTLLAQEKVRVDGDFDRIAYETLDTNKATRLDDTTSWDELKPFPVVQVSKTYQLLNSYFSEIDQINPIGLFFRDGDFVNYTSVALLSDIVCSSQHQGSGLESKVLLYEYADSNVIIVEFINASFGSNSRISYRYIADFNSSTFRIHFGANQVSLADWLLNTSFFDGESPFASLGFVNVANSEYSYYNFLTFYGDPNNPELASLEGEGTNFPDYEQYNFDTPPDSGMIYSFRISDVTGVDFTERPNVKIYPNPGSSYLNIDQGSAQTFNKAEIVDLTGRIASTHKLQGLRTNIELSHLETATYLIKLSGPESQLTQIFVKQ